MKLVESQFDKNDNSFQSLTARKIQYHYTKFYKNVIFFVIFSIQKCDWSKKDVKKKDR